MIVLAKIADREAFIEGYGKPAGALLARFGQVDHQLELAGRAGDQQGA